MLDMLRKHSDKNHDYARGGPPLGNFNRVSAIMSHYPNLSIAHPATIAIIYMMKQLDAVLWALSNGHALTESIQERWSDVVVYSVIIACIFGDNNGT